MNFGERKRHISSDAVPAISTRPEIEPETDAIRAISLRSRSGTPTRAPARLRERP